jgi:hypothetical protein
MNEEYNALVLKTKDMRNLAEAQPRMTKITAIMQHLEKQNNELLGSIEEVFDNLEKATITQSKWMGAVDHKSKMKQWPEPEDLEKLGVKKLKKCDFEFGWWA